jgi:hypothetical protein
VLKNILCLLVLFLLLELQLGYLPLEAICDRAFNQILFQ